MTGPMFDEIADYGRMLADGIPFRALDVVRTRAAAAGADFDWFEAWMQESDRYVQAGREALANGHPLSGGDWLWRASLCAHYAQFMWFHDPSRQAGGRDAKVALYREAAPHLVPAAERIEIEFDGILIPGYLRRPLLANGSAPQACVLLVGGLESTKEESYLFENLCIERGLATFAFDGPGQGEVFAQRGLQGDFERYTAAVLDHLADHDALSGARFGVLGRSLGGHYALRSAACDRRLEACVAWGVCFDVSNLDSMPPHTRDGFLRVTAIEDHAAARRHVTEALDLHDVAPGLQCPTYVLQGRHDPIFSADQVQRVRREFPAELLTVVVEEEGNHCCHNMADLVRPRMADWLAERLAARPPA